MAASATTDSGHRRIMPSDHSQPVTELLDVETREGPGRWHVDRPRGVPRAQLLLGHGAGGGVESRDLVALATTLTAAGVQVARFEQPWQLQGRKVATPPQRLDAAWLDAVPVVQTDDVPLVIGGRSAGARVACRTADRLDARGVIALAFPLHPPGRPERSRADELTAGPALLVQGSRDPFGTPEELAEHLGAEHELCEIPGADHSFKVPLSGHITNAEAIELMIVATRRWIDRLLRTR